MRLLVATKNPAKAKELARILGSSFELVTLADLPGAPDVEETGATFMGNALLKARAYFEWSGIPTISDDGGLEIDALGGQPGVLSRRWPDSGERPPYREKTDDELIELALTKLAGVPDERRTARLRVVGAFVDRECTLTETAAIEGRIVSVRPSECEKGYPFRSVFLVPKFGKLYKDLTSEEHGTVNHRRVVYLALRERILAASS